VPEGLVRGMVAFYPGCQAPARKVNAAPLAHIAFSQNADETVKVGGNPDARADALKRVPAFILGLPPVGMAH
jgi:dienelactone hydrolase